MLPQNTTRFAGFEIGSTKLAAFAMSAQIKRYGSGSAFDFFTAARTAGGSTTAVASFNIKPVTPFRIQYSSEKRRVREPLAKRIVVDASQSNTPWSRASSDKTI